jgi:hypothetical protein
MLITTATFYMRLVLTNFRSYTFLRSQGPLAEIEARKTYARTTSDCGNPQQAKMGAPFRFEPGTSKLTFDHEPAMLLGNALATDKPRFAE